MSKNTLCVYDTITKKYVEIEVNDEVYMNYRQTGWAIKNNDRSFFDHEIQFSMAVLTELLSIFMSLLKKARLKNTLLWQV